MRVVQKITPVRTENKMSPSVEGEKQIHKLDLLFDQLSFDFQIFFFTLCTIKVLSPIRL